MAKARALDKRRKSIRNIRKITRTMELIATARFKKAMDRAHAATAYTKRITRLVADLAASGLTVSHPLLAGRDETERATLLVLTANRGLCGGYNSSVQRAAFARYQELKAEVPELTLEVSGKRGISAFRFRGIQPRRDVHPLRRQAQLSPKSKCWPTAICWPMRRASSIGWTWPTCGSRASAGRW